MLTRHINTIFIILIAYNTSIRVSSLTNIRRFYCANISLRWTYFKYCFVHYFKLGRRLTLITKTSPCSVCSSHIFYVKFTVLRNYSWMSVWQMLILRKCKKISLFSTHCYFFLTRNLNVVAKRRSFYNIKNQHIILNSCLKLITAHF